MSRTESINTSQSELSQSPCSQKPGSSLPGGLPTEAALLHQPPRDLLLQARHILELGLANVCFARTVVALNDGNSIADISWVKVRVYRRA